jgi:hypothetical protein
MSHTTARLVVGLSILAGIGAEPAATVPLTQIQVGSPAPFTSLDGGVTQTPALVSIVNGPNGTTSATQVGGQSDSFCFGPGLGQCFAGSAGVDSRAFAGFGVLRLETLAEALASPTAYGPPFVIGTNPYTAVARTSFILTFTDDVDVTHPTLPDGSAIQFSFKVALDSAIFGNSQASFRWGAASTVFGMVNRGVGFPFPAGDHFALDITVDALVGDTVPIFLSLSSGGQASAGFTIGRELDSTGFDAFSTATLHLDAITPGLGLRAASGHDYATVPEPSTALLAALGLLVLARLGRTTA